MWKALRRAGEPAPRCRVQRLMRSNGIVGAKRRGKPLRTTRPDPQAQRRPDLVQRDFAASGPNELWVADISYLRCWEGLVFFAFVLDAYSRMIVGWQLASHMRTDLVLDALTGSRRRSSWPRAAHGSVRAAAHPQQPAPSGDPRAAGSRRTQTRPTSCRSARPRSGHGTHRRSGSLRSVRVELLGEKHARRLQDLVRSAQLEVLLPQPLDLLALLAGRQLRPQALVGLRLAHPLAQRLGVDPEITGDVRDRTAALKGKPHPALEQLLWVLPRSRHDSGGSPLPRTESRNRGPRETRSGSSDTLRARV
jgi:Integrase core domain